MAPDVSWSPFAEIIFVLLAAMFILAFRKPARRPMRVFWAGAMVVLAAAAIGTGVRGYQTVNAPLDDPSLFGLCSPPDPNLETIAADLRVENPPYLAPCQTGTEITLSRGETMAVALEASWYVDFGGNWTGLSVSDSSTLQATSGSPYQLPGPPNSQVGYEVGVFSANHPGETTVSAVVRSCRMTLDNCDRGNRWWITIRLTY